jgi:hypothetical protein
MASEDNYRIVQIETHTTMAEGVGNKLQIKNMRAQNTILRPVFVQLGAHLH